MKEQFRRPLLCGITIALLCAIACSHLPIRIPSSPATLQNRLTPSEQAAGEIMAYLMEVVLGQEGPRDKREEWATRGLDLPLDFDMVSKRMFGPVPLRAELMVLDTNILGLSEALYHYDKRLNLFKGRREHDSLYPCTELIAIRLLLLKKLHRKEKVRMAGIDRYIALFSPGERDASRAELEAMQLTASEFRFLKRIFTSEPAFFNYMRHPFIVAAFRKIGIVEQDPFTLSADLTATYNHLRRTQKKRTIGRPLTIAIIPGMNPMFDPGEKGDCLKPTEDYLTLQKNIQTAIFQKMGNDTVKRSTSIDFFTPNQPIAIVPANADRVMEQLCPQANFTVVLMGKNVYRGLFIDPASDVLPHKNYLYLDVDDIRYGMVDEDIEILVDAIQSFGSNS
jgi:hypothetical protein